MGSCGAKYKGRSRLAAEVTRHGCDVFRAATFFGTIVVRGFFRFSCIQFALYGVKPFRRHDKSPGWISRLRSFSLHRSQAHAQREQRRVANVAAKFFSPRFSQTPPLTAQALARADFLT
jgi:hypothetical protein